MGSIFLATFGAVFLAEIAGDKLLYTTGVLATRYRPAPIMAGVTLAFMLKMGVAVMVGEAISRLPHLLVAIITSLSFVGIALALWRKPAAREEAASPESVGRAAALSFAAVLFSEWGDVGQITAATMAARYPHPLVIVWVGAVAAMATKGILAASVGAGLRGWIQRTFPPIAIRWAGVVALLLLGVLAVFETFER